MRAPHRTLTLRLALALAAAFACLLLVQPSARADDAASSNPEVRVTTNMGSFVIELYPNRAPLTVADFLSYVREGFYTNTLFHRVVANFVIQGGGHDATAPYALKPVHPPVDNESGNGLQNKRGAVGLARAAGPHTGNAQFYVNLVDNPELDPLSTRWGYAVFGQVVQGMDVVDRIGVVATGSFGPFKSDAPLKPVIIQSVEVITPPQLSTPAPSAPPAAAPSGTPPTAAPPPGSSPQAQPGEPGAQTPPPSATTPGTTPATPPPATPPGASSDKPSGVTQ
ncbi:MAG: peptidylprolyl isomerase, partial [Gammaproteobacteria bacterium]|nr:peptidylprolyl isomerase [Gammaproteobacteria bacterium]